MSSDGLVEKLYANSSGEESRPSDVLRFLLAGSISDIQKRRRVLQTALRSAVQSASGADRWGIELSASIHWNQVRVRDLGTSVDVLLTHYWPARVEWEDCAGATDFTSQFGMAPYHRAVEQELAKAEQAMISELGPDGYSSLVEELDGFASSLAARPPAGFLVDVGAERDLMWEAATAVVSSAVLLELGHRPAGRALCCILLSGGMPLGTEPGGKKLVVAVRGSPF